jgi:TolB-like protein/class 3 adenylate cyclase/Flp pilus assembly protein TadD
MKTPNVQRGRAELSIRRLLGIRDDIFRFALDRHDNEIELSEFTEDSEMSAEVKKQIQLEIAHVLFIDIVGYSKLSINDQHAAVEELNQIVRASEQFAQAEAASRLLKIPTGDGMALVFYTSPEAPAQCAVEISRTLKEHPRLQVRMGVHSGPVSGVIDVNGHANLAGAGLNMAQRVMACGDAGHILLSKRVADDLGEYEQWRPLLHDLGACEVKHGMRVAIVNLHAGEVGNSQLPKKFQALKKHRTRMRWAATTAALLALAAIVAAVAMFSRYGVRSTLAAPEKSIAVLPLENLSEEKANAFFADGIQDELLSNLAKIKDLKVISRTSVMQYKSGITRNLKEIAQQLGVSNVVEGSVRRSGNHVRVSVQLIDAQTDRHIWVQNYDRTLADSLTLQDQLATEIAAALGATLSPQEKAAVEAKPTNNPAAYDAYLRGRAFAGGSPYDKSNVERTIQSYQEAVKLDPSFTLAWARLSYAQSNSYWLGLDPSPAQLAAAKDAADRALALDPNLPETHLALGYYRYYGMRDYTGGLAEFQQAERGLPNNVDITDGMALIQRRLGHWEEAIDRFRRVVELDPRNTNAYNDLALTYSALRRFPEALATVDRALAWEPANTDALGLKASVFWATGDLQAVEPLLANPGTEPRVPGYASSVRGVQALFQRRYAAAIEIFSSAVAARTKRGEPSDNDKLLLGLSQQRVGDVAAARATCQKAALDTQRELDKVAPGSKTEAGTHAGLGWAYAGLGEAASAIAEGQKATAMEPTSKDPFEGPRVEENMAGIYALLGGCRSRDSDS